MKNLLDLSREQELAIAAMNLISLEEHLAFTEMKTEKQEYLELLEAVRSIRRNAMENLVKNREGEAWCISKHLLAATMRLTETAAKYLDEPETAKKLYAAAQQTWILYI